MKLLTELFAWWTGNTIGTRLYTWRFGARVGSDDLGNIYYETKDGKRRWVVYARDWEASLVPPEWHGWLHHTVDVPPTMVEYTPHPWEKRYEPNPTGTPEAYRPPGSLLKPGAGRKPLRDYEPWTPG
jgi:NADH:ubiquinone oxidoreductase subunit